MSSNCMFLAHHYGLVNIFEDEILSFHGAGSTKLQTKHGRCLEADVILLCIGFGTDETVLQGHVVRDSFFVDGRCDVTHNLRGDRVNGRSLIGPLVKASNFLISYYEDAQEYERAIIRFNEDESSFEEFSAMHPDRNFGFVHQVDYFTTLELSDKLAQMQDSKMRQILRENRHRRASMYKNMLPEDAYLARDAYNWETLSRYFAAITNKPVLKYPFPTSGATGPQKKTKAKAEVTASTDNCTSSRT